MTENSIAGDESGRAHTLTPCPSCGKSISVLAEQCVGCGSPNTWIHPEISSLIDEFSSSALKPAWTVKWSYGHDKERVWGNSVAALTRAGWTFRFVQAAGWLALLWFGMTTPIRQWYVILAFESGSPEWFAKSVVQIIATVGYAVSVWLVKRFINERVPLSVPESTFEARFQPKKQWTSTNESLWAPVRTAAGFDALPKKQLQSDPIDGLALFFNLLPQTVWTSVIAFAVLLVIFVLPLDITLPRMPQWNRRVEQSSSEPRIPGRPKESSESIAAASNVPGDTGDNYGYPEPSHSEPQESGFDDWGEGSGFTVIVGSEATRESAELIQGLVKGAGFETGILRSDRYRSLRPGYWVVFVGKYSDKATADSMMSKLRSSGFSVAYSRYVSR